VTSLSLSLIKVSLGLLPQGMDDWCSFCGAFVFRCDYHKGWRGAVQICSSEMKERVPSQGRLRGINGDSAAFSSNTCIDLVCELLRAGAGSWFQINVVAAMKMVVARSGS